MATEDTDKVKRMIIGKHSEWLIRFDESEYLQNPPMIRKLYEEKQIALTSAYELEKNYKDLEKDLAETKLTNQRLELQLGEFARRANLTFIVALVATVILGIGINVATSSPSSFIGWVMIVTGVLLELVSFLSRPNLNTQ